MRGFSIDESSPDRAKKIMDLLLADARVSLDDLEFLSVYLKTRFPHENYRHVKTGNIYRFLWITIPVGDRQPCVIQVAYSPLENPGVVFHQPMAQFEAKFVPVKLVEVWQPA
jgi:hypothetical protein